jgi:hypothetical protein
MEVFWMLRAYFNFDNKRCTNVQRRITEIIGKVKTIVTHFKYSSKTTAKLRAFQESKSKVKNPWKLLQDLVTRWNSTFYMIKRFVKLEEAVRSTVALLDADLPKITLNEWCVIKELKIILDPFEDTTRVISGQKYLLYHH